MRTLLTMAAALLAAAVSIPAYADPFTSVVVYGDSLSDNGNVLARTGYFPPFPYVGGRFSNGPVAVEQLAGVLGVPIYDHAFGGATSGTLNVLNGNYPFVNGLPGMLDELSLYLEPASVLSTALTVVWGGANDFAALSNPTDAETVAAANAAVGNIVTIVNTLQANGAGTILVPDLPDLGRVPRYAASPTEASLYSTTFNTGLQSALKSGAIVFDTNAVFSAILGDLNGYGFSHGLTPCIAEGAFPACNGYLFFDDLHPTTAADAILARDFAAAAAPTPEPSSLLLISTGAVSAIGLIRRRRATVV